MEFLKKSFSRIRAPAEPLPKPIISPVPVQEPLVQEPYTVKGKELQAFFDKSVSGENEFFFESIGLIHEANLGNVLVGGIETFLIIGFNPTTQPKVYHKMIGFREIAPVEIQPNAEMFRDNTEITFESKDYYENTIKKYIKIVADVSTIQDLQRYCKFITVLTLPDGIIQLVGNKFNEQPFIKSINFKQDNVFFHSPPFPRQSTLERVSDEIPDVYFNDGKQPEGGYNMKLKNEHYKDVWKILIVNPGELLKIIKRMSGGKRPRIRYTRRRNSNKRSNKRRPTRRRR
jgi:hypothetical protein